KEKIAMEKRVLSGEYDQIHAAREKEKVEYTVHSSLVSKRENLLGDVREERKTYARHVVELEEISASLERELQELIRREQEKNRHGTHRITGYGQSFIWPVGTHLITSPFGWRVHPLYGRTLFHTGVDIGAGRGSQIHAAADGVVIYSGWYGGYGQAVVVDHGG